MKRLYFAPLIILACFITVHAENRYYKTTGPDSTVKAVPYFSIHAGYHLSVPGNVDSNGMKLICFDPVYGLEIGGSYHMPINRNFYFEPGISLYYRRIQTLSDFYNRYMTDGHIGQFGAIIPAHIGWAYRVDPGFGFIRTGPELDIGLYGKEVARFENGWGEKTNKNCYDSLSRVNVLWNFGIGLTNRRFVFGIDYAIGMTNFVRKYDYKAHNYIIKIYIGLSF